MKQGVLWNISVLAVCSVFFVFPGLVNAADCQSDYDSCLGNADTACVLLNHQEGTESYDLCKTAYQDECQSGKVTCENDPGGDVTEDCTAQFNFCVNNAVTVCDIPHDVGEPQFDSCVSNYKSNCYDQKDVCDVTEKPGQDCQKQFDVCGEAIADKCANSSSPSCITDESVKCSQEKTSCDQQLQGGVLTCAGKYEKCKADAGKACSGKFGAELVTCLSDKVNSCDAVQQACNFEVENACGEVLNECQAKVADACKDKTDEEKTQCEENGKTTCEAEQIKCQAGYSGSGEKYEPPVMPVLVNPLGSILSIPQLVGKIISIGLGFLGSLALLMFVYGGFLWMTSRGDANQIKKGTGTLLWAAIGIVFVFSSYSLLL